MPSKAGYVIQLKLTQWTYSNRLSNQTTRDWCIRSRCEPSARDRRKDDSRAELGGHFRVTAGTR